jgi:hypothetical protein
MKKENRSSDLLKLINTLAADADSCDAEMKKTGSSLARRNYVRAIFAWIEAISYLMRQHVYKELLKQPLTPNSIPKLLAASETSYYVDGKGDVVETGLKTRTSNNLRFSLRAFAEIVGLDRLQINKGGRNWQFYSEALKIRDRITHPKRFEDVELTDKEIEVVREAKGMIIAYIQIFSSPSLISYIMKTSEKFKEKGLGMTLTLKEEELKRFGIE